MEDAFYDNEPLTSDQANQLAALGSDYPFTALQKDCFNEFIKLGMNPGGYGDKVEFSQEKVEIIRRLNVSGRKSFSGEWVP